MVDTNKDKQDLLKRIKVLHVDYHEVLDILNPWNYSHISLTINREELPEGFYVVSVHNNPMTRGFDMLISHPSFDVVEPGAMPPRLDSLERIQSVYIIKKV